jgi:hypothetical protein
MKSVLPGLRASASRAFQGEERLWKVWWCAGIPVAWITSALVIGADHVRSLGQWAWGWGDLCDVARLVIYLAWFRLAWRCSGNVQGPVWTPLARVVLSAGLVLTAMF